MTRPADVQGENAPSQAASKLAEAAALQKESYADADAA